MVRLTLAVIACLAVVGCVKTGIGESEQRAQRDQFGQDAYEEAMIKAGREKELQEEKEKWAQSQGNQDQGQGQ